MDRTVEEVIASSEQKMQRALGFLEEDMRSLRTGQASAALIESVTANVYGGKMKLRELATVSVVSARAVVVVVWDVSVVGAVKNAILNSELGITPAVEKNTIHLQWPVMSEEYRRNLIARLHKMQEETKIAIRNVRRSANERITQMEKDGALPEDEMHRSLDQLQKKTDQSIRSVDATVLRKEKEIMGI